MSKRGVTWAGILIGLAFYWATAILLVTHIVKRPHHDSPIQEVAKELVPPVPEAISLEALQKCNRLVDVMHTESHPKRPGKPNPPSEGWPTLEQLPVGADGWIIYLNSNNERLYANPYEKVSPAKAARDNHSYAEDEPSYDIHIRKVSGGVSIDCASRTFVIPSTDDSGIRVVSMFH